MYIPTQKDHQIKDLLHRLIVSKYSHFASVNNLSYINIHMSMRIT